jgi:hypothetical protein
MIAVVHGASRNRASARSSAGGCDVDGKNLQQHARLVVSLLVVKHDSKIDVPRCHTSVSFDCTPVHDAMKGEARRLSG